MDLRKFSDSLDYLWVNQNLNEIVEAEKKYLINLFDIKEKIVKKLDELKSKWLQFTEKELFDNLSSSNDELYKEFFLRYCDNWDSLDFLDLDVDSGDESEDSKHKQLVKTIRFDIWKYIFLWSSKEKIFDIVNHPMMVNGFQNFIESFTYWFLWSLNEVLWKQLGTSLLLQDFLWYFKQTVYKDVLDSLNKYSKEIDLAKFLDIVAESLSLVADSENIKLMYFEFLRKSFDFNSKSDLNLKKQFNFSFADEFVWLISPYLEKLIKNTYLSDFDIFSVNYNDIWVDGGFLANQVLEFVNEYITDDHNYWSSNEDDFASKIYTTYLDENRFIIWKKIFLSKIKLPISVDNIKILRMDDSSNVQEFVWVLRDKYPKAKKYIWKIGVQEWKSLKSEFIVYYKKKFLEKLEKYLDNSILKNMSLVQLFTMMHCYLIVVNNNSLDIIPDFEEYVKNILEERFRESDKIVSDKEKEKDKMKHIDVQPVDEPERPLKVQLPNIGSIQKKEWLSSELMEDINFYFTSIDINHSEEEISAIIKIIEKLPRKSYKRKWFKDFELNDIFFQNLDKNWYQCIDEVDEFDGVDESSVNSQNDWLVGSSSSVVNNIDDDNWKISDLLVEINNTDDIEKKIDLFVAALDILYDFSNKELFRVLALDFAKSDVRILKWIISILERIVKWQREELKTSRNRRERYFTFDIWYNTWYRIVLQDQDWTNRKKIIDFVNHDDYMKNLSSYYRKY